MIYPVKYHTFKAIIEMGDEAGAVSPHTMTQAFAKAYVEQATKGAMVSDDVLCSSIGASDAQYALLAEAEAFGFSPEFIASVQGCIRSWDSYVLTIRHGAEEGLRRSLIRGGMDPEKAEQMVTAVCK